MIRAIIVDDESLAIDSLKWEIENFTNEIQIAGTYTKPKEAINGINELKPDLVFLDIEMPEIDGFKLLEKLEFHHFDLIITTAYNQYAIQAFKANAIDYLLKPIDPSDLVQAVDKVKIRRLENNSTQNIEKVLNKLVYGNQNRKIPLKLNQKFVMVNPEDIIYCKSDGSYTQVYLRNGDLHLVSKSIKQIEEDLPTNIFIRTHKSYIINIHEIVQLSKQGYGEIVLSNQVVVPISRTHRSDVYKTLHIKN